MADEMTSAGLARVYALAMTGAKRSPSAPDIPTVAEAGYKGYETGLWYALLAPAGVMSVNLFGRDSSFAASVAHIVAAFVLGALLHGGDGLQVGANVSPEIVQVVLGLILLAYAIQRGRSATNEIRLPKRRLPWTRSKR